MIVRLKAACTCCSDIKITIKFQFYDSPIKSVQFLAEKFNGDLFQFYDSPIKREALSLHDTRIYYFNSMIVRLKDYERSYTLTRLEFQFYDSPIKSAPGQKFRWNTRNFNSMIVRLKV